ncbi:MAG: UMP kinase [Candidatus Kerfeldbacteria bacterium]|nr:UMP kinase [Candidatus Kerfeldbacteria bacterium]
MKPPLVISLGGSVIVPRRVDVRFLKRFVALIRKLSKSRRIAITCGGGAAARSMAAAARALGVRRNEDLHWIGIRQTATNAEVVRAALGVRGPVITSYSERTRFSGRIVVAAGRRPGGTTDYCAVVLARALGATTIYNITDVAGVYSADPRVSRRARLLPALTWRGFLRLIGSPLMPSMHAPFDPVASRAAARHRVRVVVMSKDTANFARALDGLPFVGTVIGPS